MQDPFTLSVIQAALNNAADEMFAVLRKTAMSPIIYEVLDVGTGVTDAKGRLVSSGAGIPSFVGVLDKAVQWIVGQFGDTIQDGDLFITNDPRHVHGWTWHWTPVKPSMHTHASSTKIPCGMHEVLVSI